MIRSQSGLGGDQGDPPVKKFLDLCGFGVAVINRDLRGPSTPPTSRNNRQCLMDGGANRGARAFSSVSVMYSCNPPAVAPQDCAIFGSLGGYRFWSLLSEAAGGRWSAAFAFCSRLASVSRYFRTLLVVR